MTARAFSRVHGNCSAGAAQAASDLEAQAAASILIQSNTVMEIC
jgi:hypothetical protein